MRMMQYLGLRTPFAPESVAAECFQGNLLRTMHHFQLTTACRIHAMRFKVGNGNALWVVFASAASSCCNLADLAMTGQPRTSMDARPSFNE